MACGGADPQTDPGSDSDPNQVFRSTHVHVNADGTTVVEETTITLAQELAENAAREAARDPSPQTSTSSNGVGSTSQAISRDGGCSLNSLWLYDQFNSTGNRICFTGTGSASLNAYTRKCTPGSQYSYPTCYTWSGGVMSFWPGSENGGFDYVYPSGEALNFFYAWQYWKNASSDIQHAQTVFLSN
jgi:hypothetical protein